MSDDALRAIARQALEKKTGARGLRAIFERMCAPHMRYIECVCVVTAMRMCSAVAMCVVVVIHTRYIVWMCGVNVWCDYDSCMLNCADMWCECVVFHECVV